MTRELAMLAYHDDCRRLGRACPCNPYRPSRPWWWWLAFGVAVTWLAGAGWVVYRTLAGHPVMGGLLARLGG